MKYAPDSWRIHSGLGIAYAAIGKNEEAIKSLEKTIEINPNYAGGYANLGKVYHGSGNHKKAITLCIKAITINPNHALAHNTLAVAYYYNKQYALAVKHCDKALRFGYTVHPKLLELLEPYHKK